MRGVHIATDRTSRPAATPFPLMSSSFGGTVLQKHPEDPADQESWRVMTTVKIVNHDVDLMVAVKKVVTITLIICMHVFMIVYFFKQIYIYMCVFIIV